MGDRRQALSVLVVDDHEDTRVVVSRMIEADGVHARTAGDGEDSLHLISADPPDLILCDLQMPRLDGFGLVRRLRADPRLRSLLVIATTGLDRLADFAATREAGFDGHLVKPIEYEQIREWLARLR